MAKMPDDENVDLPPIPDTEDAEDVALPPVPPLPEVTPIAVDMPPPRDANAYPIDLPATPDIEAAFKGAGFEKIEQTHAPQQDFGALVDKLSQVAELVAGRLNPEPQQGAVAPDAAMSKADDDGQQAQFREFIDLLKVLVERITPKTEDAPPIPTSGDAPATSIEPPDPIATQDAPDALPTLGEPKQGNDGMADVMQQLQRQNELLGEFKDAFMAFAAELVG